MFLDTNLRFARGKLKFGMCRYCGARVFSYCKQ